MKKYPKYMAIPSSLIAQMPSNWTAIKLKYVLSYAKGKQPDKLTNAAAGDPYATMDYLRGRECVLQYPISTEGLVHIDSDTLLVLWDGANAGEFLKGKDGYLGSTMASIEPKEAVDKTFLFYLLKGAEPLSKSIAGGTTIPHFSASFFDEYFAFPSFAEQKKIAAFLDYKTGKIDSLVSLLSERIEDLKKYRQAVISETVTHGLDKSAKMKDSGVAWIGEIPESWSIIRLRFLGTSQNGISKSKEFFGQGYPFVSYSDVYKNESLPEKPLGLVQSTEDERENFSVKEGDVFFTRTSETAEEIGFSSVCEKTIENATFAGFLIRFRPNTGVLYKGFSKYFFRSDIHRCYFVNKMNIVTRASLSQDILMNMPVVLPPLSDQQAIANYLDRKTKQIDDCIAATEQRIDDLQKYRTSLIYEAVTGQIDVRDWTANKEKNSI